jgi:uncharacterized repeat protein (TIGR01451 family)
MAILKSNTKRLDQVNKHGLSATEYSKLVRLPRFVTQLFVSFSISGLVLALVLGLLLFNTRQIQAAPSPRPLAAPGSIVTHTAVGSATHEMTVFGNGQLTNQFLADNISRTNLIGASISHTTIAVLFDQHSGDAVDVGSQLEFVETTTIFTGPSTTPGYYEESYGVYASPLPSPAYQITQRTLATSSNNCVIMELTISNTGVISLTGGKLLYMVDIQVGQNPVGDTGGFDPSRQMVYQTDFNQDGFAFGISLLSGDLHGYSVQDDSYLDPALDSALRSEMITPTNAITDGDDNISWLVTNIPTLLPQGSAFLAFNLCAVTSTDESSALDDLGDIVDGISNLSVLKVAEPAHGSSVEIGDPITYTITISSTGSRYVDNIVLTDTIPAGTDLSSYDVTQGSITANGDLVTATIGRLYPASGTVTVTLVVELVEILANGTTLSNQAFINSQPTITRTNIVIHNVSINPGLLIQKTGPAVARVGDTVVYDIIVTNATTNTYYTGQIGAMDIGDGSPITITQVTDTLGPVTYISGDNGDNLLSGTEQWTYRITHTIVSSMPNPLLSQASVEGRDMEDDEITATTTMRTDINTTVYSNIFLPIIFKN